MKILYKYKCKYCNTEKLFTEMSDANNKCPNCNTTMMYISKVEGNEKKVMTGILIAILVTALLFVITLTYMYYKQSTQNIIDTENGEASDDFLQQLIVTADTENNVEESQIDYLNKNILSKAMNIDSEDKSINHIINFLNSIEVGQIQEAQKSKQDGETVLYIVSEDNTNYCIFLTASNSVDAIQNTDTGEYLITSER